MASRNRDDNDVDGCVGCFAALLAIAAVVSAVMAIAALVDPFSLMPPVGEVFSEECDGDKCGVEERYPGFWGYVFVNFGYAVAALVLVVGLLGASGDLRKARAERFVSHAAVDRFRAARVAFTWWALGLAALATIPFLAAWG